MSRLVKLFVTVFALVTLFSEGAHAQDSTSPLSLLLPANGPIQKSDYPCALVLCVLKPSASDCSPVIDWLVRDILEKGRAWPTCGFAGAPGTTASYAAQPHIDCPSGFTPEQASSGYGSTYTGVCLRPVSTCATKGSHAYTPSVTGAACYTYTYYDNYGNAQTEYFEYVIPSTGVTSYAMTVNVAPTPTMPAYNNTFYFNLNGSTGQDLAASIINSNANSDSSSYTSGGGRSH